MRGKPSDHVNLTAMGGLTKRGPLDTHDVGLATGASISATVNIGKKPIEFFKRINGSGGE